MAVNNSERLIVYGKVTDRHNRPLRGLLVQAFDRDMRSEELVGEAITGQDGQYVINYTSEKFSRAEKNSADLLMRVFAEGESKVALYEDSLDSVRFNCSALEEIDIHIGRLILPEVNEFDQVLGEIGPLIERLSPADLQEDDNNRDITFLTRETSIAQEKLEYMVVAHRMAQQMETNPAFYYALLRKNTLLKKDISQVYHVRISIGVSSDVMPLLYEASLTDPELIYEDVKAAVQEAIVPQSALEEAQKITKILSKYAKDARRYYDEEQPKRVINLVSQFLLSGKIFSFGEEWARSGYDLPAFTNRIFSEDFFKTSEDTINAKTAMALGEILGYNDTIVSEVGAGKGIKKPEDVRKLAAMNKAEWKETLTASASKKGSKNSLMSKDLIDYHASALARSLEKQFPSVAYQAQLNREETPFLDNHEQIKDFLNRHEDFELHKTNVDVFLKDKKLANKKNEGMRAELKKVQRVFKLAPKYSQANALLQNNVSSAQHIVGVGKGRFVNEIAPKAGLSAGEAKEVFARAERVQTAAMLIAGDMQSSLQAADVAALATPSLSAKLEKVSKDFPSMKTLFQTTDSCACEHCRSVYSPAAYLVEVLRFISQRSVTDTTVTPHTTAHLAKDLLFDRRPELGDIDLGCENAETPVPYIDLVCELLEEKIAPDAGINFNGEILADPTKNTGKISATLLAALQAANLPVTDKAQIFETESPGSTVTLPHYLRDTKVVCKIINTGVKTWTIYRLHQTLLTAEELAAAPEYVNDAAYTVLNQPANAYAFTLPFDLYETGARAYFDRFGISRADLMENFQFAAVPNDDSIGAERLSVSDSERKIIVTADPGNQQLYWCTGALAAVTAMKVVDTFLTKSGLTYEELDTVLALQFIDPAGNLFIKELDPDLSSCDTTKKEIANLDDNALDRLHRFLRLQKKTKWKIPTVDEIISQTKLGNGNLDNSCLRRTGDLVVIAARTGLTMEELVCCYGEFPHDTLPYTTWTPYDLVFQNKAKNGSVEPGISAAAVTINESAVIKKQLADFKTAIAVCLHLKSQDFDTLVASFPNTDLNFENLSTLYAISRFLIRLKLKADDYLVLTALTGLDPFNSPVNTIEFINAAYDVKSFPLKLADIRFMISHEATNLADREIKDATLDGMLRSLQASYQQSFLKNLSPFDASLGADEQKEAAGKLLSGINLLSADDVKIILNFVDQNWVYSWVDADFVQHVGAVAADAPTFIIDKKLSTLFNVTSIINTLNLLGVAVAPNVDNARLNFLKAVMDTIAAYQFKNDKQSIIITAMTTAFKTDADTMFAVLNNAHLKQVAPGTDLLLALLTDDALIDTNTAHPLPILPPINAAAFPKQYGSLKLLHKLIPLINAYKFDATTVPWFLQNNAALGWMELDEIPFQGGQAAIPYNDFSDFSKMVQLINSWTPVDNPADAGNPLSFFTLAEMILDGTTTRSTWIESISLLSGYEKEDIDEIDNYFGFSILPDPADLSLYQEQATWQSLVASADYLRKLGVSIGQVKQFIKPVLTAADTDNLRNALKALYDETTWLDTLKQITDKIRPKKRDALVAYLLAVNPDFDDANDLYDYFMVDSQMEACMPSSRIVLAHSTIQLFVERCLMGAEPKATADTTHDPAWDQWKWMKNYRVWEANRKIFLYPENYIEPELLDDKSYLFDELINESHQNELTEDSSNDLLIRFLEKLDDIAFLEVVATWYQADIMTMHVIARSKGGDPRLYYYRTFEKEAYWTPWQKMDLDITTDLVVAFVRNNRFNVAWAVFSEEPKPTQSSTIPSTSATTPIDNEKPKRKLKIQLAISEYANGQWKPKKISVDGMTTPDTYVDGDIPRDQYNLLYMELTDQIWLFSSSLDGTEEYNTLNGIFDIAGCKGYPELAFGGKRSMSDFFPDFKDAQLQSQRYDELNRDKSDDLAVRNVVSPFAFYQLLGRTPGKYPNIPSKSFHISYPLQLTEIDIVALLLEFLLLRSTSNNERGRRFKIPFGTLLPYFMEDSNHAYVIIPGFYNREERERGYVLDDSRKRTAWNVFTLINNVVALFNKYLAIYIADPSHDIQAVIQQLVKDSDYQDIIEELRLYRTLGYGEQFKNLYHPLICSLRKTLYKDGIPALMDRKTQMQQTSFDFNAWYQPQPVVPLKYPVEDIDFKSDGSYSLYNWELFFHTPLLLATQLGNDQKFEEALTWFHYIFNPTGALDGDSPQKYWVTKPFFLMQAADYTSQRIDDLLYRVSVPTSADIDDLHFAIDEWRNKPFKPHVVARYRPMAYMKATVMKYIRHLMNWGDYLFRQDTMESVAQATRCYTLAQRLAGKKPRKIPPIVKPPYETYNQIEAKLDAFGNALIELENIVPDVSVLPEGGDELPPPPVTLSMLYFCIPPNDDLLAIWDQIDNRLFNIRHCRNIDGVERSLALFAPPIDPAALVRAAAAGLDISSVLAGMNAPIPNYRFSVISQKATELIQEVRELGSSLLQALEKKDAEDLSLLKSQLDIKLLKAVRDMKKLSIADAKQQIVVLQKTRAVTDERHQYYVNFKKISDKEQLNLDKLQEAQDYQFQAQIVRTVAGVLGLIPEMHIGANGFGGSPEVVFQFGGSALSRATNVAADVLSTLGSIASFEASRASTLGNYDRRYEDAKLQHRLSGKELLQIDEQIAGAKIKQTMAETDLSNHDVQIDNAQKMDQSMHSKYTNKQLYDWMIGKISSVYFSAYQLAFDFAKKAERCYQHELGNTDTFIGFGYWDSLKKGLQTSDQLLHDLKRMEGSYLDKNKREYEIPKPVSLALLDPFALVKLRATGSCDFEVPESLFDMEFAGQYFRRLRSVSISIPCVAGPYTTLGAKLSLVSNRYRKNNNPDNAAATGYTEDPGNDERFVYNVGSIQSIAVPAGQNESGLFELNFKDERYLPFEGCGAIGTWRLELPDPAVLQPFDYNTISDVILHLKYTAREGGSGLKAAAEAVVKDNLDQVKQQLAGDKGLHIAFNMRRDMPNEWNLFRKNKTVDLAILKSRLPYFVQSIDTAVIDHVTFIAKAVNAPATFSIKIDGSSLSLNAKPEWSVFLNDKTGIDLDTAFTLSIDSQAQLTNMEDLMMLVSYKFS
jgi:hypothetical protein